MWRCTAGASELLRGRSFFSMRMLQASSVYALLCMHYCACAAVCALLCVRSHSPRVSWVLGFFCVPISHSQGLLRCLMMEMVLWN
ncbi:MAG: hypothetical protein MAG451_01260 [Anaerolineales bacterium]|nr:hypothetical protein [Anaerolineales bacterium]